MRIVLGMAVLATLSACGGDAKPTAASCADICADDSPGVVAQASVASTRGAPAAGGDVSLSGFEKDLLTPYLEDVRGGVRPYDAEGIGICKGSKSCDAFLGGDVGELEPGKYMVKAELRVPNVGEPGTWKITFDSECTTTRKTATGETTSTSNSSREYDVRYAGADRGYRLMPLRTIESPSPGGSRKCSYKITAPRPDGDKVYTGSWETPDAG